MIKFIVGVVGFASMVLATMLVLIGVGFVAGWLGVGWTLAKKTGELWLGL